VQLLGHDRAEQNTTISVACVATTFVLLDKGKAAPAAAAPGAAAPGATPAPAAPQPGGVK